MKQAPLQLIDYHASKLQVVANDNFNSSNPVDSGCDSIKVDLDVTLIEVDLQDKGSVWQIKLNISQKSKATDIPYHFAILVTGLILAHPTLPEDRLETIIKANGTALLFGVAREMIRNTTAMGPYEPVILPSTNFLPADPKKTVKKSKAVKKKVHTKKSAKKKTTKKKPK